MTYHPDKRERQTSCPLGHLGGAYCTANREGSFLALLHLNASVGTNATIAIPASFAARALVFASLIDVLVFHRLDDLLRLLRLEMIE